MAQEKAVTLRWNEARGSIRQIKIHWHIIEVVTLFQIWGLSILIRCIILLFRMYLDIILHAEFNIKLCLIFLIVDLKQGLIV